VYSTIAYQCSKIMMQPQFAQNREQLAKELRDWIFDTEYNKYGIPKPDLNLFLNVPIEFVDSKLKESRNGDDDRDYLNGKEDIHEADIKFQISVREIYLQQTELDPNFVKVCCEDANGKMLPPAEIFANIKEQVDKLF
jgi:dTMP kinase